MVCGADFGQNLESNYSGLLKYKAIGHCYKIKKYSLI